MSKEVFVQVGVTALRGPGGEFLPAVPLYIKAAPADVDADGAYSGAEPALQNIADVFADKFKKYADAARAAERRKGATA